MTSIGFFVTVAVITALMTVLSLAQHKRAWVHRGIMVVLFITLLPVLLYGFHSLTGTARPIWMQVTDDHEGEVVWSETRKGQAILLLVALPSQREPIYFRIDWDEKMAKQLEDASEQAEQRNGRVRVKMGMFKAMLMAQIQGKKMSERSGPGDPNSTPGEGTPGFDDREPVFHPPPPIRRGVKQQQGPRVIRPGGSVMGYGPDVP